jgi:predicted SAM-dependent methyltransferase
MLEDKDSLKINLGSGLKRFDGFINVDADPAVKPDFVVNLDCSDIWLPFSDNSVVEIKAWHILEHIGDGFIPLMKELYRISKHHALLDIQVPHHQHDVFYGDITHKRPITVNAMNSFSKKYNLEHQAMYNSSTGIGLQYDLDFEIIHFDFEFDDFYKPMLSDFFKRKEAGQVTQEEDFGIQRLLREATNVALNTNIKMIAIKEGD